VTVLLELRKFLASPKRHPRARHLLNIPDFVFQERRWSDGKVKRCHLVVEDLCSQVTKRCRPLPASAIRSGLCWQRMRAVLGTLAQMHASSLAFGLGWGNRDDQLAESFPFLARLQGPHEFSEADVKTLLDTYEKLLLWQQQLARTTSQKRGQLGGRRGHGIDFGRRLRLVETLRASAGDLLAAQTRRDRTDAMGGLCLGSLTPDEVVFQGVLREQGRSAPADALSPSEATLTVVPRPLPPPPPPTGCAAALTVHRMHLGQQPRDVACALFTLASPATRDPFSLVSLLQCYAHVLTSTLELLDVDWARQFGVTFGGFLERFYRQVPHAVLRAVLVHMRMTSPTELEALVAASSEGGQRSLLRRKRRPSSSSAGGGNAGIAANHRRAAHHIPLTEDRIAFLVGLSDRVLKATP